MMPEPDETPPGDWVDDGESLSSSPGDDPNFEHRIKPIYDGILKQVIQNGHGSEKPRYGDVVEVHYTGRLHDTGEVFDSSRERNEKFKFSIGQGQVIIGWEHAVTSMKRNELSRFIIQPDYCYGTAGAPPKIPPNAVLEFEIELFDWKMEDLTDMEGGVLKRVITDGTRYGTPNEGSIVELELEANYEGKVWDKRGVVFNLGEGSEVYLPPGVEIAASKMKVGEKAEVHIRPKYMWGIGVGKPEYGIPDDYKEIVYELHLKNFDRLKESYEMTDDELLEQSELSKTKGNDYFKQGKINLALKMYKRIVKNLAMKEENSDGTPLDEKKKVLLLAGHLNCAICYLKLNETFDAIRSANLALELDPMNEKALFRRGTAYSIQKDYDNARRDFHRVLEVDPNNKAARAQFQYANQAVRSQIEREKATYRNLFARLNKSEEATKKEEVNNSPDAGEVSN